MEKKAIYFDHAATTPLCKEALDKAVDSVFSDKPLKSEEERQKVLFEAYGKIKEAEEK